MTQPRIGLLYTHLRAEEKLLRQAAGELDVDLVPIWDEQVTLDLHEPPAWSADVDAVLVRTLSLHRALALTQGLEHHGIPCINPHDVLATCGDKWTTSLALARAGVPTPGTRLATTREGACKAAEAIGYPVVTKPLSGSWARLVARVQDPEALEALVEQREVLGHPGHHQHYLQEHIDKPDRDIRAFVLGERTVAAIHRESEHWITNTARGAVATHRPVDDELDQLCVQAARAVGGGPDTVLAVDLMEAEDGLVVHEVNATMEFRNSIDPTGVDLPRAVLEHVARTARGGLPGQEVPA